MDIKAGTGTPISKDNEVLLEYGKKVFSESVTSLGEYIKLMIPLNTGLITAYFALLEFVGVKTALDSSRVSADILVGPPIILLMSLIAFIVTLFPIVKNMRLDLVESIRSTRKIVIRWRYIGTIIGMALFLFGIISMIYIITDVIESSS